MEVNLGFISTITKILTKELNLPEGKITDGVQQSQNANQSISNLQSTGEHDLQLMALRYASEQPGKLPDYKEFSGPSTVVWGQNSDEKQ